MVRPTINSEKHIVQVSLQTVAFGNRFIAIAADAVNAPNLAQEVRIGSSIKAVFVEMWVMGPSAQPTTQTSIFLKVPADAPVVTGDLNDLHNYQNKKNIFYTTQGLVGDSNSNPIPILRQWIKIPRGKQRMGQGDSIIFAIIGLTADVELCGQMTYKEYF